MFTTTELAALTEVFEDYLGAVSGLGCDLTLYRLTGTVEGTIAAQEARVEAATPGRESAAGAARATSGDVYVMMAPDANVRKDDRFLYDGQAYLVTGIRPNRQIRTWVDAQVIQP